MDKIINFVLFHAAWLACVLGAARAMLLIGPAIAIVVALVHVLLFRRTRSEVALLCYAVLLGTALDTLMVSGGVLTFNGSTTSWPCPLWITALWLGFATTLNSSLSWLRGNLACAAVFGGVGGPLAYYAGARLGALRFDQPSATALGLIAIEWAVAMVIMVWLARRGTAATASDMPCGVVGAEETA